MKGEGWSTNRWRGDERSTAYTPDELLAEAFWHDPYFAPGTDSRYSSTNYIVAGELVEAVTGQPYSTVIEHRILRRLNVTGHAAARSTNESHISDLCGYARPCRNAKS